MTGVSHHAGFHAVGMAETEHALRADTLSAIHGIARPMLQHNVPLLSRCAPPVGAEVNDMVPMAWGEDCLPSYSSDSGKLYAMTAPHVSILSSSASRSKMTCMAVSSKGSCEDKSSVQGYREAAQKVQAAGYCSCGKLSPSY